MSVQFKYFVFTLIIYEIYTRPLEGPSNTKMEMNFLHNFGYMSNSVMEMKPSEEKNRFVETALIMYQKYNHLNATGKLDNLTMEMMKSPRCGNNDMGVIKKMESKGEKSSERKKRFVKNKPWEKSVLTYRFKNYAQCCLSPEQLEEEFHTALSLWVKAVSPSLLILKSFDENVPVDLEIEFVIGPHHDNMTFVNNTVAHAFYPQQPGNHSIRGDIHYNDEVEWTSGPTGSGQNFLQASCHELGHSLGLEHTDIMEAVMFATVDTFNPNFDLHPDDVKGLQALYQQEEVELEEEFSELDLSNEAFPQDLGNNNIFQGDDLASSESQVNFQSYQKHIQQYNPPFAHKWWKSCTFYEFLNKNKKLGTYGSYFCPSYLWNQIKHTYT